MGLTMPSSRRKFPTIIRGCRTRKFSGLRWTRQAIRSLGAVEKGWGDRHPEGAINSKARGWALTRVKSNGKDARGAMQSIHGAILLDSRQKGRRLCQNAPRATAERLVCTKGAW